MSRQEHPFLPEELMAYIDGELPADQAAIAAKHLETCAQCSQTIADTGRLSHAMAEWIVEEPTAGLTSAVLAEAGRHQKETRKTDSRSPWWGVRRSWVYGLAGSFAVLFLVMVFIPSMLRSRQAGGSLGGWTGYYDDKMTLQQEIPAETPKAPPPPGAGRNPGGNVQAGPVRRAETKLERYGAPSIERGGAGGGLREMAEMEQDQTRNQFESAGPMIIRTVQLNLITKEFDKARTSIDTIVRNAKGYIEQLQARGEVGTGRALSVTLRVPVDKLESSLTELRKLGHVQTESQNSSDVSNQYVDLEARLKNARNTEQRFLALLRERTGTLKDVVEAEREIARVREEIERMDAQLKNLSKSVALATIQIEFAEEFHADLRPTLPTTGTRLGNAAVNGYKLAVETVVGFVMVILLYGPTLLLLAAVLALVALIAWRIQKRQRAKQA